MTWRDRDYEDENPLRQYGRPGGDWQGLRPSFDNPITWSLSVGRVYGIEIRIHAFFLLFIVIELLRAMFGTPGQEAGVSAGVGLVLLVLTCLFVIVLLHEFGHCIACRYTGGTADEILMWPLGGLAYCQPPNRWQAHMVTVVGGPAVNVAICALAGPMLGFATGHWLGVAIPNPVNLFGPFYTDALTTWAHQTLYTIHALSFLLLLFNMLPMFPLDGGRFVQTALWPRFGYATSMRYALRTGFIGAVLLGIFGLVFMKIMIVLIAVFGGIVCWITHKQLQFTEEMLGHENDEFAMSLTGGDEDAPPRRPSLRERIAARKAEREAQREAEEAREVDRILKKISEHGMDSLDRRERRLLKKTTEKKRSGR